MKNTNNNKKIQLLGLLVVIFLTSAYITKAVFVGPTAGPTSPNGQPQLFIFKDKQMQLKDGAPGTPDPTPPGNYTLRTTKSNPLGIGLGTEGILSWTADFNPAVQNSNRALIAYGKLVADLSGVTGLSPYARTAVKLFSNANETMLTTVISNKPTLGFWTDGFPLGSDTCYDCSSGEDWWSTGFFGKAALSSLILGDHSGIIWDQSYSFPLKRTDLDVAGFTNIGQGDYCVIRREDTCPMGSALTFVFQNYASANYANQIETINGLPFSSIPSNYSNLCTYFDPKESPKFLGMCPLDPLGPVVNGQMQSVTDYDPDIQISGNGPDVISDGGGKDGGDGKDGKDGGVDVDGGVDGVDGEGGGLIGEGGLDETNP